MIQISQIKIGKLDARNEIFQQERENSSVFHNSFVMPPSINFENLVNGSSFFIQGPKGSGKTALLRFLMYIFSEMKYDAQIVLFKSDLTETERQKLIQLTDTLVFADQKKIEEAYDYKQNWLWFILRQFAKSIQEEHVSEGTEFLHDLKKIMNVSGERESIFSGLQLTKIRGILDVAFKSKGFKSALKAEIEAISNKKERSTEEVVSLCELLVEKIKIRGGRKFALVFDELELFLIDHDQKTRDLFLIRDLLYAVLRFNRMVGTKSPNLMVYAAIRSEILVEINRVGPEIVRDVQDLGVSVEWDTKYTSLNQPLLEIITKKIQNSEIELLGNHSEETLKKYFPKRLFGKSANQFLLDISMFKPRNLVRLLTLAQDKAPNAQRFEEEILNETATKFSSGVWLEIEEELSAAFTRDEVKYIKQSLTGYKRRFSIRDFGARLEHVVGVRTELRNRLCVESQYNLVVEILYRAGAVGNVFFVTENGRKFPRNRWCFRGYSEPSWKEPFEVHESLLKALQLAK